MKSLKLSELKKRVIAALKEDVGQGDVTSQAIFGPGRKSTAVLIARQSGVIAGMEAARIVFNLADKRLAFRAYAKDGSRIKKGAKIAKISGSTLSILKAERVALNLLQRLSGIATVTSKFTEAVKGTGAKILDTRKTTPLWRDLEKWAVRAGGGYNHRMGLYDAVLIKDNHIAAAGSISKAVEKVKNNRRAKKLFIEVETKNFNEVMEAYRASVDRIMFDNMAPAQMRKAVIWLRWQKPPIPETEASGGVNLANVAVVARTDVDYISIGALTHSPGILDISLLI